MQAQIHAPRTGYAYNLLDNSDFRNPVNQRGQTTYTEGGYTIDRWKMASKDTQLTVNNGYITITNNAESGRVTVENILPENHIGEVLTVAVCDHDTGNVYCMSGTVPEVDSTESQYFCNVDFNGNTLRLLLRNSGKLSVCITVGNGASVHLRWAALYEGAYTADTLPPYQPKGYAAELAECQRYFESVNSFYFNAQTNSNFNVFILYKANKRISNPTVTVYDQQGNTGKVSEYEDGTWKPVNVTVYSYVNGFRISGIASTGYATISLKAASSADL